MDGRNPNHQLKTMVSPSIYIDIYRVSTILSVVQDFAAPSTVGIGYELVVTYDIYNGISWDRCNIKTIVEMGFV